MLSALQFRDAAMIRQVIRKEILEKIEPLWDVKNVVVEFVE